MNALQAENTALREQIDDLRSGRGIFLELQGQRFPLYVPADQTQQTPMTSTTASTPQDALSQELSSSFPVVESNGEGENYAQVEALEHVEEAPTAPLVLPLREEIPHVPTSPLPVITETTPAPAPSTFLEEMLISEFEQALTSPPPPHNSSEEKKEAVSNEEQMASLRRELMGSYILE
ncbi:hypothetical protein KTT_17560 [Tengunoibacter tsumagoiensis]|uniref:Uncharacterized protein n=2 Tax=Tengunoibacter tsumagoiensis TaxID=2014871 RepID=A0A401ZYI1_9CHLR|nr:hypothetical protein KTT_17560 [Tengunoibacter tsumagoiensis]